jgi:hypothetical protein
MGNLISPQRNAIVLIGKLIGANFNTTADQQIPLILPAGSRFRINSISVSRPSVSLTTAAGGFYSGAGKTGTTVVAASQVYSGLSSTSLNTANSLLVLAGGATTLYDISTLYLSLTTPQGSAATADIHVYAFIFEY